VKEREQGLDFAVVHVPMFQIQPDAIETKMRGVANVGRDEVSQRAHANCFILS
jgi:hypothetical protein